MKKELAMLKKWQKRLRLQDWDVEFEYLKPHEMVSGICQIRWDAEHMSAVISAVRYEDTPNPDSPSNGIEHSIIHELLHLHLRTVSHSDETGRRVKEAAINTLVSALMDAYE